jgi:drug/metabolite transporter (DMT)-like permease
MHAETRPDRASTVAALLRVVLAGACWALAAVLAKYAFERGVPPVRLAEARVAVALLALAPVLAWRRPDLLRPPPGTLPILVGFGACVAAVNLSYYLAIDHLPVGVAVALQYTGPAILLAATTLLAGRRAAGPGRRAWVAAGVTLAGAVLVSRALEGLGALNLAGLAAGVASAVLFAAYLLAAELAGRRGVAPATTLLWGFLVSVAIWAVAAPWWSWPVASLRDPEVALAVLGVGLLGTLLPFALAVGAVRVISAATAGIAATAEPVFAAAFAWLLLGQTLTPLQLAGGALVVAGVVLAQLAAARTRTAEVSAQGGEDVAGDQGRGQTEEGQRREGREAGLAARPDQPARTGDGQRDHRLEA